MPGKRVRLADLTEAERAARLQLNKEHRQAAIVNARTHRRPAQQRPGKAHTQMPDEIKALPKNHPDRMAWLRSLIKRDANGKIIRNKRRPKMDIIHNKTYWATRKKHEGLVNDEYSINQYKYAKMMMDNTTADNPAYSRKISRYVSARVPTPADKAYIKYFYPIRTRTRGKKVGKLAFATLPTDPQFLRGRKLQKIINMFLKKYKKCRDKKDAVNYSINQIERILASQGVILSDGQKRKYKSFFKHINARGEIIDLDKTRNKINYPTRTTLQKVMRTVINVWNKVKTNLEAGEDPINKFVALFEHLSETEANKAIKDFIDDNIYFKHFVKKDKDGNIVEDYIKVSMVPVAHAGWGYRGYGFGKVVKKGIHGVAKGVGAVRKGVNYAGNKVLDGVNTVIPGSKKFIKTGNRVLKDSHLISTGLIDAGGYGVPAGIGARILGYGLSDGAGFIN